MAGLEHIRMRNNMELENRKLKTTNLQLDVPSTVIHNKIKYGNIRTATFGLFSEYCQNSSIHGLKYLGEPKRSLPERFFWICFFAFSIYRCASAIGTTWNKWQENPVIVSFNEKSTPVWKIPFPAITICPELKFQQDIYNFTKVVRSLVDSTLTLSDQEKYYTDAMAQICDYETIRDFFYFIYNGTNLFGDRDNFTKMSTIISILEELLPFSNKHISFCYWQTKYEQCNNLFKMILTKEGICFSFNLLAPKFLYRNETVNNEIYFKDGFPQNKTQNLEWNIEDGYSPNASKSTYPKRSLRSGTKAGLFLWLYGDNNLLDKICRGPIQGFKMLLHSPDELDDISSQYIQVPLGQQILIAIKPKILHTSDRLKTYSPEARQCYFQDERFLRYFKYYNQKNCQLECLTNFTYSKCGCVRFDMPRNKETPVCGLRNLECYNEAEISLLNEEFQQDRKQGNEGFTSFSKSLCDCLPACTSIAYETEISQAAYNVTTHFESFMRDFSPGYTNMSDMTRLFIFFKEQQFLTSKRSELYGTTDFIANCGGLLGLFMGVSLLSLVEFIYFCTFRLGANLKMRRQRNQNNIRKVVNFNDFNNYFDCN